MNYEVNTAEGKLNMVRDLSSELATHRLLGTVLNSRNHFSTDDGILIREVNKRIMVQAALNLSDYMMEHALSVEAVEEPGGKAFDLEGEVFVHLLNEFKHTQNVVLQGEEAKDALEYKVLYLPIRKKGF